jgi:hypothetical protein
LGLGRFLLGNHPLQQCRQSLETAQRRTGFAAHASPPAPSSPCFMFEAGEHLLVLFAQDRVGRHFWQWRQ